MHLPERFADIRLQAFIAWLKDENLFRFYIVSDRDAVFASDLRLQFMADFLSADSRDFMGHEGLFFEVHPEFDIMMAAFVHRTNRGQGAGGLRFWHYDDLESYVRDGLRLSKGMTRKNALAGLWWGGGKGVISSHPGLDSSDSGVRDQVYSAYGKFVTSLNGCYITAEDVGTKVEDMASVFSQTRFTTCVPPRLGGSGNPSTPTARGVVAGMEAAMAFQQTTLEDKVIAVQGSGNVGTPLVRFLLAKGVRRITVVDTNPNAIDCLKSEVASERLAAEVVTPGDNTVLASKCDILAPCAIGAVLNAETIPKIKAKVICGAANNQLEDAGRDDQAIFERGILYVPDFLTNRMGIVNCANEQYGKLDPDPDIEKHLSKEWDHSVYQSTLRVLTRSQELGLPPAKMAMKLADEMSLELHPIFGHRGKEIIDYLVKSKWHEQWQHD